MASALLVVDQQNQNDWPDKLDRWNADVAREGWTPDRWVTPPGLKPFDVYTEINRRNPSAVKLLGDVPVPGVGPLNPDGHYPRYYPSDIPYGTIGADWNTQGGTFNHIVLPTGAVVTRRVGRVYFEQQSNIDKKAEYGAYLDRVHAARTGQKVYEQRAFVIDHLAYMLPNGGSVLASLQALLGANCFAGLPDQMPDQGGDGSRYYSELDGHSWFWVCDFSGGLTNGTGMYYTGTSQALQTAGPGQPVPIPLQRPDIAFTTAYASMVGEFTRPDAYVCALLLASLGVLHLTDVGYEKVPDFTLLKSVPVPEMVRIFQNNTTAGWETSLAWSYHGDPTLPILPTVAKPPPQTTVSLPVIPPTPTTGATPLTADDLATIKQMLADSAASIKADYTQAIASAIQTVQQTTSQGQTNNGQPTTAPATGTVTVANGTFAVPKLGPKAWQYNPPGTGLTFSANSGMCADGSDWGNPPSASGQCAFIQSAGQISNITISGLTPGKAQTLLFSVAQRVGWMKAGPQTLNVLMDGQTIGTVAQPGGSWQIVSVPFTPTAASHTFALKGMANGDSTMFIQSISVA